MASYCITAGLMVTVPCRDNFFDNPACFDTARHLMPASIMAAIYNFPRQLNLSALSINCFTNGWANLLTPAVYSMVVKPSSLLMMLLFSQ
jgi:hypothetical protein